MSSEDLSDLHISDRNPARNPPPAPPPPPQSLSLRLRQTLASCSKSIESEEFQQSQASLSKLVAFLDSISGAAAESDSSGDAYEALLEIRRYISSPSLDQAVVDGLSFELPKAVCRFAGVDARCREIVDGIVKVFVERCSPRDMLSVICEALDSPTDMMKVFCYLNPLLRGLSAELIFSLPECERYLKADIQVNKTTSLRHFEQVKAAVPVIFKCLKVVSSESDDEDVDAGDLFDSAIGIATSIQAVCLKLEGAANEKLRSLLGLYVLQLMALISITMRVKYSRCLSMVLQLSNFLPYCGSSYLGFITDSDINKLTSTVVGEDDDYISCFSYIRLGAALAVVWGQVSDEVAQVAKENLNIVKDEIRMSQTKRWQTIGLLKHILSFGSLPWKLKKHSISFLLEIMDAETVLNDKCVDHSSYVPGLVAGLQAVEMVIMNAPDVALKKNAFLLLKKVVCDIPTPPRFDVLEVLITNCDSSSMIAILMDCIRVGLMMDHEQRILEKNLVLRKENKASQTNGFWSTEVLDLVELVLRPPKGGPPSLPEQSDAVMSALNLYRYVLMTELAGKTNCTGALSKRNLEKAHNNWLLPLCTLVAGIRAENEKDHDELAINTTCAINLVESALYRCIELVKQELKHCS